jgi:NADP-dependent alcohol dehydrogenase
MENFDVVNPTRILFGKDTLQKLPELLKSYTSSKNILVVYGGESAKKIGLLDELKQTLDTDFTVTYFGGVEANPEFSTLMKAVELAKEKNIGFIIAVGGGSVIDGVKFITGAYYETQDPWEILLRQEGRVFTKALPFATILTLPATGSEANSGAVISRSELKEKRTMGGPLFFPKFSLLNPTYVATLPKRQIANGIIDAFVHTLEQYLTRPTANLLQEREAEGILSTLLEIGPKVYENPSDYKWASNLMWCANHALNGNLRCGVPTDWVTHMIGHELTAFFGIDHARSLAIIGPRLYENQFQYKREKLVQCGKRVFQLEGEDEVIARNCIKVIEDFYHSLDVPTKISEYTNEYHGIAVNIRDRFIERSWTKMGENLSITPEVVHAIVESAI